MIDDSLVIRKMVEIALEDEDYNISTAVSGKEGLDSLDKINPDLVILDMMLPDINGIEILKTIKASKGIPVIMLSGKDEWGQKFPLFLQSFGDYKPALLSYIQIPFVWLLGLNISSVRLPVAILGVVSILSWFFIEKGLNLFCTSRITRRV